MAKRKNWFSLFFTNYLGVLNDNFLKTLACFICIAWVGKENESMVVTLASAALVIPYLLFSPLAGRLAKIYKKRKIVVWAKGKEWKHRGRYSCAQKSFRQAHRQRAERDSHKGREIEWGWGEHVQRTETGNKAQSCCSWWSMYIKHTWQQQQVMETGNNLSIC